MTGHFEPTALTPLRVASLLRSIGFPISTTAIEIGRRGERTLVILPDGRLAWFALTAEAADHLGIEDRLLGLISDKCSFRVPKVLTSMGGWTIENRYGIKHRIIGPMLCPDGTTPTIFVIWQMQSVSTTATLVTAYPN